MTGRSDFGWKHWDENISRVLPLSSHDGQQFFPSGAETVGSGRKVMLDRLTQLRKIVKGDGGKHVMLHMILHVPVKECGEPTTGVGTAAKTKIGDIRRESDMLRRSA
jgi:hypothetical protein